MKGLRGALWGLLALFFLIVPAQAEETVPSELMDALPPQAQQHMEALDQDENAGNTLLHGFEHIGQYLSDNLFSAFRRQIGTGVMMLGVVVLCAMVGQLRPCDSGGGDAVTLAGALSITLLAVGGVQSMLGAGQETVDALNVFSKALLPTLAAATAASGGLVSASVQQVATVLFADFLTTLIRQVLMPVICVYIAVAVAEALLPQHPLKRLRGGVGKAVVWTLTMLLVLFTGYLTVSGAAAASSDALTLRLTRTAIGTAVPVVGGIISEATESVLAGAGLIKNAIGIFGMLGVLMICLTPFMHLAVQYLTFKLTAFFASLAGSDALVELIDALGTAFALVLGMAGSCAVLLLISVSATVSAVST